MLHHVNTIKQTALTAAIEAGNATLAAELLTRGAPMRDPAVSSSKFALPSAAYQSATNGS